MESLKRLREDENDSNSKYQKIEENNIVMVVGDLHVHPKNLNDESKLAMNDIVSLAKAKKPIFIVFLGDVFDAMSVAHSSCLREVCDMIKKLKEIDNMKIYILTGNHDRPSNKTYLTTEHAFHGINQIPNVFVAATEILVNTDIPGWNFAFAPYVPPGQFRNAFLDSCKELESFQCIFAHQDINGVKLSNGKKMEKGDDWNPTDPLLVNGHIHGYSHERPNFILAGACWQQHASDGHDRKIMFMEFKPYSGQVDYRRDVHYERVRLESLPIKKQKTFTAAEFMEFIDKNPRLDEKKELLTIEIQDTDSAIRSMYANAKFKAFRDCHRKTNIFPTIQTECIVQMDTIKNTSFLDQLQSAISQQNSEKLEKFHSYIVEKLTSN